MEGFKIACAKPGDPTSAEGAGWIFVISLPITVPLDIFLSFVVGQFFYAFTSRRLQASQPSKIDLTGLPFARRD
jgi:hypothetical protein